MEQVRGIKAPGQSLDVPAAFIEFKLLPDLSIRILESPEVISSPSA